MYIYIYTTISLSLSLSLALSIYTHIVMYPVMFVVQRSSVFVV